MLGTLYTYFPLSRVWLVLAKLASPRAQKSWMPVMTLIMFFPSQLCAFLAFPGPSSFCQLMKQVPGQLIKNLIDLYRGTGESKLLCGPTARNERKGEFDSKGRVKARKRKAEKARTESASLLASSSSELVDLQA